MSKVQLSMAASLPTFSGSESENINFFLDTLNQLAEVEKWCNEKKLLVLKLNLRDQALNYIIHDTRASNEKNVEKLQDLLRKKFTKHESFSQIHQDFSNIVQLPKMSVNQLAEIVNNNVNKFLGLQNTNNEDLVKLGEKIKLDKFLNALRTDLKIEVKKLGANNFEEAVQKAKNIENALSDTELTTNNITYNEELCTIIKNQMEANKNIQELAEKVKNLSEDKQHHYAKPSTSKETKIFHHERVSCHICGKPHLTTKCWFYQGKSQIKTYNFSNKHYRGYSARGSQNRGNFRSSYRGKNNRPHPYFKNRGNLN